MATVLYATMLKELIYKYARDSIWEGAVDRGKQLQLWFLELGKRKLHGLVAILNLAVQFALILFNIAFILYLWDFDFSAAVATLVIFYLAPYLCFIFYGDAYSLPIGPGRRKFTPSYPVEDVFHSMRPPNPDFWRKSPLFPSPPPGDITAAAGAWLLENDPDFSSITAVAAIFSEFQWPVDRSCTVALIQLRDMYEQCVRAPKFDDSTRLKALQSAAAYYVLYHTQLIRGFSKPPLRLVKGLPPDLFVHEHTKEWGGEGVFEYLLYTENRSEPVTSARFLSYIAPYWFCGDSDSTIESRPSRLEKLDKLIDVLENSQAFTPATLTNCMLCVGAAMDFPLHPEDLVRVDKRCVPSSGCRCRN
jgi:hypothetical protein